MPLLRLPLAALLSAALLCVTASVAAADAPWSVPIPVPGVGNGAAAATARGHVAALTISGRNQPPSTASQLVRLNPADGAVLSSTGIDLTASQPLVSVRPPTAP
jgi:hypothetical protein